MKKNWKPLVLVLVLCVFGGVPFLIEAKNVTALPDTDASILNADDKEKSPEYIQTRNEKMIKRHPDLLTKDMVNMKKLIRSISWVKGQTITTVRIRYEDGTCDEFTKYKE